VSRSASQASTGRRVWTPPQPMVSKYPGQDPETALCSGVRWSLVISVTDGRESTRSPRWVPPASSAEAR
jgi:hypothetical protein